MGVAGSGPAYSLAATTAVLISVVGVLAPASLLYCGLIMFGIVFAFRTAEQREERMKQVPMHRYGTPEEVAQLVAFLLSDESNYITGAEIAIDGASSA